MKFTKQLDCTLRDGGYYNSWDFPISLIDKYLAAVLAAGVHVVELGLRSRIESGFKGGVAYTTEAFLDDIQIPEELEIAVMINAAELLCEEPLETVLSDLFPRASVDSSVSIVRVACHAGEFSKVLEASTWLKDRGYKVCFNLMQVVNLSSVELRKLALKASQYPIDVLYFADSTGSAVPNDIVKIVNAIREGWKGAIGIHAHDNLNLAMPNTLKAIEAGVSWVDATVTGMGRGPGNTKTEYLALELKQKGCQHTNLIPLLKLIRDEFEPMQKRYGWGTNTYYYLAGKLGIHPTYIQEMLGDSRYNDEEMLAVIEHLKANGAKKYSSSVLSESRLFSQGEAAGSWEPSSIIEKREVLILGSGPGVQLHRNALERYIENARPIVVALNTQSSVEQSLINLRVACHPVRLLADCEIHAELSQPLVTPAKMLSRDILNILTNKKLLDYGIKVIPDTFDFSANYGVLPNRLVISYALAMSVSGMASRVLLAGFDGYSSDDPRTKETQHVLTLFSRSTNIAVSAVTPTRYDVETSSIYSMGKYV